MRPLLALLTATSLLLVGCGDDDDDDVGSPTTVADDAPDDGGGAADATTGEEEPTTTAPPAEGAGVTVQDFAFEPQTIEVSAGDAVTWTNQDGVAHTATAGTPGDATGAFDERLDASGGSAEVTFDEAGTYDYFCAIHPTMTGQVVVS